jgi:predicted RNA binding protein YcfA (HicA-like mRNA interferase family)
MCQLLKSRGWTLDHISGSHYIYTHPDAPRPISVPVHGDRDLRARKQRSIMREAGLTEDDLSPYGNNGDLANIDNSMSYHYIIYVYNILI